MAGASNSNGGGAGTHPAGGSGNRPAGGAGSRPKHITAEDMAHARMVGRSAPRLPRHVYQRIWRLLPPAASRGRPASGAA